jgi:thiaminase/transcriptional activator TenA
MRFTEELWQSIERIYAAILRHLFLTGLTDGSLPLESVQFHALQDALYLRECARALSLAAARSPQDDWIIMFNEDAAGALRVERALHEGFFREFGLSPQDVAATPLAPTTLAYTRDLLRVAHAEPFHEMIAARLPCYWIYWEVGKEVERAGSPKSARCSLDWDVRLEGVRQPGPGRSRRDRRGRRAASTG